MNGGDDQEAYDTAAECIAAGMYWFSQSDLAAAEAWWRRALELEPDNPRAASCLSLLKRTSSTGFKHDSWAELPAVQPEEAGRPDPFRSGTHDLVLPSEDIHEPPTSPLELAGPISNDLNSFVSSVENQQIAPVGVTDGLHTEDGSSGDVVSPWDMGPSRTSVITIDAGADFDAVPDPTPLPELDRERFFNRGDPSSRDEIVDFLKATGDLPQEPEEYEPEVLDSHPIYDEAKSLTPDAMADAVATEPATSLSQTSPQVALQIARDRYQLHDFQGVLDALEDLAQEDDQTEIRNMLAESRANLLRMYEAKIGGLDQIPEVLVSNEEVIWLNLNHRAGFILSQVDGTVSYDDLISLSGMPRLDTVRILTELLEQRVIGVSGRL